MATKSKHIKFYDAEKLKNINSETMRLWQKYLIDMELRELSPKTIAAYQNDLEHWWIYIYDQQSNRSVTELDEDDITQFLYFCKTQGNNSRRMKRRMSSIAAFYKYLRKKKIISENPMEFIDRPKKDVDIITQTYLTSDQIDFMRIKLDENVSNAATIQTKHNALMLRLYAFFSLSTMARVNAVRNTMWNQIDYDARTVNDVIEKEGYVVTLYFSKEVAEYLKELRSFRAENEISDGGFVFMSERDGAACAITSGALNEWCKRIGRMINIPTLHAHDFRHSGATLLKRNGMTLEDISSLLNHAGTDVTNKYYIKEDKAKIQSAKDKFEIY